MVGKSLALVFLALVACAAGISFHLPVATRKCLQEDVHKDVLVVGNYEIEASDLTLITLDVSFFFWFVLDVHFFVCSPSRATPGPPRCYVSSRMVLCR